MRGALQALAAENEQECGVFDVINKRPSAGLGRQKRYFCAV